MTKSVLAVLGEDALFQGAAIVDGVPVGADLPCRINIEYDVQFAGDGSDQAAYRGDITLTRDVATVPLSVNPAVGKTFRFVDKATGLPTGPVYKLDRLVDGNGYTKRFIVLARPAI